VRAPATTTRAYDDRVDIAAASARAMHVRGLYEQMEERFHGSAWTPQELVVGFMQDVGDLGRLVMAAEGRWTHGDDLPADLGRELSECLWWVLVLAERLGVDITDAFTSTMDRLDARLTTRLEQPAAGAESAP
jgi:NTP pyrophosphatase (non-canonical NTP hydrolase)